MCIAILNVEGTLSKETLQASWQSNPHGAGFAHIQDGKIVIVKEMNDFEKFYQKYVESRQVNPKSKFLVHFRIATQGEKTELNCHPFAVNDSLAFIHNGMIADMPSSTKYSDTYFLNSMILQNMVKGIEYSENFQDIMKIFTGTFSNKLVFLNSNNDHFIINENLGHWKDGNWYSNHSYCYTPNAYRSGWDDDYYVGRNSYNGRRSVSRQDSTCCEVCNSDKSVSKIEDIDVMLCSSCKDLLLAYQEVN